MTDIALSAIADFTAAGFIYTLTYPSEDSALPYKVTISKPLYGGTHQSGVRFQAVGYGASTAAATATAIAAANNQRAHRYGFGTTVNISKDTLGTVEVQDAS